MLYEIASGLDAQPQPKYNGGLDLRHLGREACSYSRPALAAGFAATFS